MDHLVSRLHKVVAQGVFGWQCQAASLVTVLAEMLFGASPAWRPSFWLGVSCQGAADTAVLLPIIERIQEDFTREELWGILSQNSPHASGALHLSLQVIL